MEKCIINLICELDDTPSESRMCYLQKKKLLKNKKRNLLLLQLCRKKSKISKLLDYFEVIKQYADDIFFEHFRMSRSTFQSLQRALKPFWTIRSMGRCPYNLEKCLYITLWKLSNGCVTFRQISDRFNIGMGTAHKVFYKTIKTICCLKKEITWPSVSKQQLVMERFQSIKENPFPYVVGCVGGTHLKILQPKIDSISYYNTKGFHSINMQAICDSRFLFLDVFIGYPGSYHDANVWKNSPIYKSIADGQMQLAQNAVVLGDSAYPISKFLLTPYRDSGQLLREQKKFNYCLNSSRVVIEQSFGILKNKFRILNHLDTACSKNVSEIILACTILHNFIVNNGDPSEYIPPDIVLPHNDDSTNSRINEMSLDTDEEGISLRNKLTTLLST